jgi:ankyrin repeat protein
MALVKLLLEKGADPNIAGQMGDTPLIEAARWGNTELVNLLLKHGADVNKRGNLGATPLITACITTSSGRTPTLKALIDAGADVTLKDQFGFTALTVAKRNKNEELVKFLTEMGVKE